VGIGNAEDAMKAFRTTAGRYLAWTQCLFLAVAILQPQSVSAKSDERRDRIRFYGVVEVMPQGLHGTWIIGGKVVTTNPRTQFDQQEGPLRVGGCAKVDIRAGLVHEIDSEPDSDCR
jgi:hypothetical protein